jgi:molecular chaperone GrpE
VPVEESAESTSKTAETLLANEGAEKLAKALSEERKRADDYLNRLKYLQADFENYKRRMSREIPLMSEAGVRRVATELLVVLDELDCALEAGRKSEGNEAVVEGVELVKKKLVSILEKEGLERIEAVGQKFDPNKHEAMIQVPTNDHEEGTIVEEIRPGYAFKGQVIRPSLVKVATRKESESK